MAGINLKPKGKKMSIEPLIIAIEIAKKENWHTLPMDDPRTKVLNLLKVFVEKPPQIVPEEPKKEKKVSKKPATKKTKGKKK